MTEDAAEHFSERLSELDDNGDMKQLSEPLKQILDNFISEIEGNKVLDVGCGTGGEADYMALQGFCVAGIDLSEEMIEYCQKNRDGSFRVMDMRDLDFNPDRFDGIWCCAAIMFVPEKEMKEVLRQFKEVLKSERKLFVNFKSAQGESPNVGEKEDIQHLTSEQKSRQIIQQAGFTVDNFSKGESGSGSVFLNFHCSPKQTK